MFPQSRTRLYGPSSGWQQALGRKSQCLARYLESGQMDINALLSPRGSPASRESSSSSEKSPTRHKSRRPAAGTKRSSGLSQEVSRSPDRSDATALSQASAQPAARPSSASTNSLRENKETFTIQPLLPSVSETGPTPVPNFRPLYQHAANVSKPVDSQTQSHALKSINHIGAQQRPVVTHRFSSTPQMETLAGKIHSHCDA